MSLGRLLMIRFYAMVDRDDDLRIGVKSTAIAFGRFDLFAIACCQLIALAAFTYAFWLANLSLFVIFGVFAAAGFAIQHQRIAKTRARDVLGKPPFGPLFIGASSENQTTDSVLLFLSARSHRCLCDIFILAVTFL